MSHSQFHCTGRVYLDMHGLIFETSICYWQDQPGNACATQCASSRLRVRLSETAEPPASRGRGGGARRETLCWSPGGRAGELRNNGGFAAARERE